MTCLKKLFFLSLAPALLLPLAPAEVWAQDAAAKLQTRALVASCASCHGTDGRATPGSPVPALAGSPPDRLIAQMKAFQNGTQPATVMHQISKGYTDEQIVRMAAYFAARER